MTTTLKMGNGTDILPNTCIEEEDRYLPAWYRIFYNPYMSDGVDL